MAVGRDHHPDSPIEEILCPEPVGRVGVVGHPPGRYIGEGIRHSRHGGHRLEHGTAGGRLRKEEECQVTWISRSGP